MTWKTFAVGTILLTFVGIAPAGARRHAKPQEFDAAKTYKSKCTACHGPKAEKKFDATKSDDEHVQISLKGKKP